MDEFDNLRLQEAILLKELELVRIKLEYVSLRSKTEQQKVISSPSSEMNKDEAIPEQTAPGKESTKPLKAVALPKSKTEVQTSTTLEKVSDLNLRPNGGIQIPKKSEGETSVVLTGYKAQKAYYVVFNGPHPGIYTTWNIAEQAVKGFPGVKHRKYKSFVEASAAARVYTSAEFKAPLELISSSDAIRPTYSKALTKEASSKVTLGTIPKQDQYILEETDEDVLDTYYSGFDYLYKLGREATEKEFSEEHYFTTDKKNVSYFNFYPNAHPDMVYEAYQYGLLSQVYPSSNLLEISRFSKEFREAVKNYRKKCLKNSDKEIYLKFTSTNIFWEDEEHGEAVQPFHYVQVGTIKEKFYSPSAAMKATLEKKDLQELAENKLLILINKVFAIKQDDKLKVNLATSFVLMTSYSHKGISAEDWEKIKAYRVQISSTYALGYHSPTFCQKKIRELKKFDVKAQCQICGPTTTKEGKSAEEDNIPTTKEDKLSEEDKKAVAEK